MSFWSYMSLWPYTILWPYISLLTNRSNPIQYITHRARHKTFSHET